MRVGLKADVVYSFFDPEIGVLKDMIAFITPDHMGMFREAYGGILKMVFRLTNGDRSAIHTFLQFYDPSLRCFVFPDYLLGPLMEDYVGILGIQIRNQIHFCITKEEPNIAEISRALYLSQEVTERGLKEKGKLPGFHLSFLEAKAKEHVVLGDWKTVCALLAVSIYGIILFPNQKNFVDTNVIRVFAQRNPIPTLIGDVYYLVHNRNEKRRGGLVRCCAQLLYKWFMGYFPSRGAFVFLDHTVKWATKLMGLRAKDIAWTHNGGVGRDFICSCGSFPNVPLLGVQGCINCNSVLLKRQMGFAMEGPPLEREIQESFYFPVEGIIARARRIIPLHVARLRRYPTRCNKSKLMDPPNADILELKEKMGELINVMQGFALGQKALVEKVEKLERASAANSGNNQEGVSNNGLGSSRDGGDPRRKAS
ncbi:hypothetical protein KIW84_020639 [Lathyrus oleraceus]|uniref:DUF7745 domain-containing protein n=1 Tax=Pisum sativum TaxID=3888 RepID=A0A9D4Y7X2_PEA|nr:hypothetical protein KIW84_020639 [Pisum sativum]